MQHRRLPELAAHDGRALEGGALLRVQAVEAAREQGLHRRRHRRECVHAALARVRHELLREQWIALRGLGDPSASGRYLKSRLCGYPYEVFACLFLDNRHRVIAFEELFRGSLGGASVHPREVVRRCLVHNAAGLILAHNHPSGTNAPSQEDRTITLKLRDALALIDVKVLDHIIVGDGEPISLAERGWL